MDLIGPDLAKKLEHLGVPQNMINRALIGLTDQYQPLVQLLDQRVMPEEKWTDNQIRLLLHLLGGLDTDKDPGAIRIGEREGRIATPLLYEITGGFVHGIGRSGNLTAPQPKAAGASLMQNLTNRLVLDLIHFLGLNNVHAAVTVPLSTGMALGMALRGAALFHHVDLTSKPVVLMPRIDHQAPIKGIEFVGNQVIFVPTHVGKNYFYEDGVYCSMEEIEKQYKLMTGRVSAIISTTTFFAPRVPDDVKAIAKFAKQENLIHIINNAYGVQSPEILKLIRQAIEKGRVDAIIQSTDKNFLTPVGGSVIISPLSELIEMISQTYAGRASAGPIVQLMVALLAMGKKGYQELIKQQQQMRQTLEQELSSLALELGENIIKAGNPISCAMTLQQLSTDQIDALGGYLYNLRITGPRIINRYKSTFGSCTEDVLPPYIVMNAAIGAIPDHIPRSVVKLKQAIQQVKTKHK